MRANTLFLLSMIIFGSLHSTGRLHITDQDLDAALRYDFPHKDVRINFLLSDAKARQAIMRGFGNLCNNCLTNPKKFGCCVDGALEEALQINKERFESAMQNAQTDDQEEEAVKTANHFEAYFLTCKCIFDAAKDTSLPETELRNLLRKRN